MAFIPAPNIVQCEIRGILDGQHVENRIYVNVLHAPTIADLNALAGALSGAVSVNWVPLMSGNWRCSEFFLRSMQTINDIQATYPQPSGSFTGTHGSPQLPNNVTLCVSLRSNFAGRSARGRLYWQCLSEDQVVSNNVDLAVVNQITSAVLALKVNIAALGFVWSVVSFRSGNIVRPGGPVYFPVNDVIVVDTVIDSQRRRLPGRGQ